jgi:1-acyl-sn-glycerol-3-phosphate acyltransferase
MIQIALYFIAWGFLWVYGFLLLRMSISRHGKLPVGPKIFVSNHPSATDPFMIHIVTHQKFSVLITEKAFTVPVFGWFLRKVREIPVPLEQGSLALDQANRYLQNGKSVAIFIEGQISPTDGSFLPPRTGAARLALMSGAPIIPIGISLRHDRCTSIRSKIDGTMAEARWYLYGPYAMTVGEPMYFAGDVNDREHVRTVTDLIMRQVRLLAQESKHRILTKKPVLATSI